MVSERPDDDVAAGPGPQHRLRVHSGLVRWSTSWWRLGLVIAVGAVVSWATRWAVDDAFITFRYSGNLAAGRGAVFNPGERVEGYTNFLWMLLNALAQRLGGDPLTSAQVVGLAAYVGLGVAAVGLARRVLGDGGLVVVVLLLVAGNGTVVRFATSGMETTLVAALAVGAVVLLTTDGGWARRTGPLAGASALAGLALLTRLDAVVVLAPWFVAWARHRRRDEAGGGVAVRPWTAVTGPAALLVVPWLVWKVAYYGSLVPNTLTAKSNGVRWQMLVVGFGYVVAFALSYGLVVVVPRLGRLRGALAGPHRGALGAVLVLWPLYVVWVGGDWMEFRFMVLYVPFLAVAVAAVLDEVVSWWRHALVAGVLVATSALHLLPLPLLGIFSPASMDAAADELGLVGAELARRFPGDLDDPDRPMLAVGAAGALPFRSRLRAVDLLGLTDAEVARRAERARFYVPGHQQISPVDLLVRRGVDLVLVMDGPIDVDPDRVAYRLSELVNLYPVVDLHVLPPAATVVEIPTPIGAVRAIVLRPHPAVDRLVRAGEWRRYPIERTCRRDDLEPYVRTFGTRTCPL